MNILVLCRNSVASGGIVLTPPHLRPRPKPTSAITLEVPELNSWHVHSRPKRGQGATFSLDGGCIIIFESLGSYHGRPDTSLPRHYLLLYLNRTTPLPSAFAIAAPYARPHQSTPTLLYVEHYIKPFPAGAPVAVAAAVACRR